MKFLSSLLIILFLLSCSDDNENTMEDWRGLSEDQISFIGNSYNDFLTTVINRFDYSNSNYQDELIVRFSELDLGQEKIDFSRLNIQDETSKNLFELKQYLSSSAYNFLISTIDELTKDIKDVSEYLKSVNSKKKYVNRNYFGLEKDALLIFLEVFEKSAEIWLPQKMGGSGIGYEFIKKVNGFDYITNVQSNGNNLTDLLTEALVADGISAAVGFIVGAFVIGASVGSGGLATPAIIAFLVGVAGEAALSSAAAVGIATSEISDV